MNISADPRGTQKRAQRASWNATVGTAVALQWGVILGLAGLAWIWSGEVGARSLFLGGAAVALPNAVLALWLTLRLQQAVTSGVVAVMMGELLKLSATIALLIAVAVNLKSEVVWLALIVGVIGALKAQWLALWFTRRF